MSGTSTQALLLGAAEHIIAGEVDVAVVAGAEALDTKKRLKRAGERPAWSHRAQPAPPAPFEWPFHPAEIAHEVFQAYLTFALRDTARRSRMGTSPGERRDDIGALLAPMTMVAADNPYAWDPTVRTATEIMTPTPENRMVATPYPKHSISIMDVDMGGALIIASHEAANRLDVPQDRRVYLRGWAEADDAHYVAEHPDLSRSPAMAWCARHALAHAGASAEDLSYLDLYSCFASSIDFALDALGVTGRLGGRDVTVTGGLPFSGGAACNYMAHSIATMAERLRGDPGTLGLTTGVGMHMTKHSWAVWGSDPGRAMSPGSAPPAQTVPILDTWSGLATIATYSVLYDRTGPTSGLAICDVDGGRTYARSTDPDVLAAWEAEEWCGRAVTLRTADGVNQIA
jgi:acetyl-CoA C-acetyltransferase